MLSKELFSKVMGDGYELEYIGHIDDPEVDDLDGQLLLKFWYRNKHSYCKRYMNAYQLMYMIKDFIYGMGYQLKISNSDNKCWIQIGKIGYGYELSFWRYDEYENPDHIFTVAQWALEREVQDATK